MLEMENLALKEKYIEYTTPEERESFVVTDDAGAEWCMKKIANEETKIKKLEDFADQEKSKIDYFVANEKTKHLNSIEFMKGKLLPYVMERLERENKGKKKPTKSFNLPSGKVGFRSGGKAFNYKDEILIDWLKKNDEQYIEVKEKARWGEFKKTLIVDNGQCITEQGEVLDFITVEEKPDNFYVDIK